MCALKMHIEYVHENLKIFEFNKCSKTVAIKGTSKFKMHIETVHNSLHSINTKSAGTYLT
jgi:hypothetical protein